jgi:hypothetical protein
VHGKTAKVGDLNGFRMRASGVGDERTSLMDG